LELNVVQLGFMDPKMHQNPDRVIDVVQNSGLEVSATCVAFGEYGEDYTSIQTIAQTGGYLPDDSWEQRLDKTKAVAHITSTMGINMLTTHIGFVPHDKNSRKYAQMVDRVKEVCDLLGERNLQLTMETGQEHACNLLDFMDKVAQSNLAVNFDPANMVLYGVGDPLEAIDVLGERIQHVHMKDANWSAQPGQQWGEEVVLGTGEAKIPGVIDTLQTKGYAGPLCIEREAGDNRLGDIRAAVQFLEHHGMSR
jgi:L-ribulose-5-phosphate 3-epimerase